MSGVSVSGVKGYGEYKNFYQSDWFGYYARIEIFTSAERAQTIVDTILATASSGTRGNGIVCTLPVECVWRIRSSAPADPAKL